MVSTDKIEVTGTRVKTSRATREMQVVCFLLADREYAIDVNQVQEISRSTEISSIKNRPDFLVGTMTLNGSNFEVMDLRRRFGYSPAESTAESRVIIVTCRGKTYGAMVDSVTEVMRMEVSRICGNIIDGKSPDARWLQAVYQDDDKRVLILNCEEVFSF